MVEYIFGGGGGGLLNQKKGPSKTKEELLWALKEIFLNHPDRL